MRSNIKEKGRWRVIDRVSAALNDQDNIYEASTSNLGLSKVVIDSTTIKLHPKLLVSGVWCLADIEYSSRRGDEGDPFGLSGLSSRSNFLNSTMKAISKPERASHRRMDRPFISDGRLQPRELRPAQQAAATHATDPFRRAQLQSHRASARRGRANRISFQSRRTASSSPAAR